MTGSMFMKAISWKEQWAATYQHTHIVRLNDEEKYLLIQEPALFKGFFDNDPMDVDSIDIVTFNKTTFGMKTAMDRKKVKKIIMTLTGKSNTPLRITKEHLLEIKKFTNSFGIVAVKIGCSDENNNKMLGNFMKIDGCNVWVRSLTKFFYINACVDSDSLVVLDYLDVMDLKFMSEKVIARRKYGRPKKTSSIQTHLNRNANSENKVELLVKFIKKDNHAALMEIFSYQVLRAYHGAYHPAVIHSYAYNHTGRIDGVIVWYPLCDVLSSDGKHVERSEEKLTINDLASDILESLKNNAFKPYLHNRNDPVGNMCRERTEEINQKYCKCKLKAVIKITNTTKNGNRGKPFYCCPKDVNNPSNCEYFRWKHD